MVTILPVNWAIYAALAVGFLAVAAGLVFLAVRLLEAWRAFKRLRRHLRRELGRLADLGERTEESAARGQSGQAIHASAFEDHRRFYYQEARVTRLIGYLYLQQPNVPFTDEELSTVNWAVF